MDKQSPRIAVLCSGLDARRTRGYEQSSLILHRQFLDMNFNSVLFKGNSNFDDPASQRVGFLSQFRLLNHWIGNQLGETFMLEYILFALEFTFHSIFQARFDYILTQEPWVAKIIFKLQKLGFNPNTELTFMCGVTMNAKLLPQFAKKVIVVNPLLYQKALTSGLSIECTFIPNPFDTAKSKINRPKSKDFELDRQIKWIVVAGAINRDIKRTHLIVDAWLECNSPEIGLCLIGDLQDESIIEKCDTKPRHFLQRLVDPGEVAYYLYQATWICLASHQEGFPNVVLESIVLGKVPYLQLNESNKLTMLGEERWLVDFEKADWINSISQLSSNSNEARNVANELQAFYSNNSAKVIDFMMKSPR